MNAQSVASLAVNRLAALQGYPIFRDDLAASLSFILDHFFNDQLKAYQPDLIDHMTNLEKELATNRDTIAHLTAYKNAFSRLRVKLIAHASLSLVDWPTEATRILNNELDTLK